jgi:hypothetical protein
MPGIWGQASQGARWNTMGVAVGWGVCFAAVVMPGFIVPEGARKVSGLELVNGV